jgi:hypothetical protein
MDDMDDNAMDDNAVGELIDAATDAALEATARSLNLNVDSITEPEHFDLAISCDTHILVHISPPDLPLRENPHVSLLRPLLPAVCSKNEKLKLASMCIVDASGSSPARSWSRAKRLLVSRRIEVEAAT